MCVEAPWPETRKGKELSVFISWWKERAVSSAFPAILEFQQKEVPQGKELSSPIYVRSRSQPGHRDGLMYIHFLYRALAVKQQDSPCLKGLQNRLRSGAKRGSAVLYQGPFFLLLAPLCWWEDALIGSGESLHLTEMRCKALLQEQVAEMTQCWRDLTNSTAECDSCHYSSIKVPQERTRLSKWTGKQIKLVVPKLQYYNIPWHQCKDVA